MQPTRRRLSGRTLAALVMLCAVPALIALGVTVFDDRKYYLISLLIIACTLVPFAVAFERRRPMARELVVIATLVALTVAGRAAFYWAPQVKPVSALVIVAGVCLGAESGLLTGRHEQLSCPTSSLARAPGPPGRCFGLRAHRLSGRGAVPARSPAPGAGGAVRVRRAVHPDPLRRHRQFRLPADVRQYGPQLGGLLAVYASGLPFDLVHAAATVLFLAILGPAMIEKLERLKRKYGLLEASA